MAESPAHWTWTLEPKPAAEETPTTTPAPDKQRVLWQLSGQLLGHGCRGLKLADVQPKPAAAETSTATPALDK